MFDTYFVIPRAVYFYCILPALLVIVIALIFSLLYYKKKGTYFYVYNKTVFYTIASLVLCLILAPLLLGYSLSLLYIINKNLIEDVSILLYIVLFVLPLLPIGTMIILFRKYYLNQKYYELLKENEKLYLNEEE